MSFGKHEFRKDKIVELCKGKTVLHLGFIQHAHLYREAISKGEWLHGKIAKVASKLVGIDYLKTEVALLRKEFHYECYQGDVTDPTTFSNLKARYQVVVCGELIEHVENPGLMLDGIKKVMDRNSVLIITTPNPWAKQRMKLIRGGHYEDEWLNKEHACWFSAGTLRQLLARKGYEEVEYTFYVGESMDEFMLTGDGSLRAFLERSRRKFGLRVLHRGQSDGLFFVARIGGKGNLIDGR